MADHKIEKSEILRLKMYILMIEFLESLKTTIPEEHIEINTDFEFIQEYKDYIGNILEQIGSDYDVIVKEPITGIIDDLISYSPQIRILNFDSDIISSVIDMESTITELKFGLEFTQEPWWSDMSKDLSHYMKRCIWILVKYDTLLKSKDPVKLMMNSYKKSIKKLMPLILRRAMGIDTNMTISSWNRL
jgi:hypothetical protein